MQRKRRLNKRRFLDRSNLAKKFDWPRFKLSLEAIGAFKSKLFQLLKVEDRKLDLSLGKLMIRQFFLRFL
ncbi:hypothetical protein WN50_36705 [Limnoraphis robusta CS-951]|uniref:Uncharacterized protein n=1 Tax=Limnoraphis robusta CS-951 TaxID=1637645 RepID=A0A0J9EW29_9CYAN|nr:hypothetical protein WN50_36705 [Limnoraphis robusta CS-951]